MRLTDCEWEWGDLCSRCGAQGSMALCGGHWLRVAFQLNRTIFRTIVRTIDPLMTCVA